MKEAAQRSQGVQLRRDPELIQKLLLKLENFPAQPGDVFVFRGDEQELSVDGYSAEQITYHLEQMKEMGLIDSPGSQPMLGVTFRSLSSDGHDFLSVNVRCQPMRRNPASLRKLLSLARYSSSTGTKANHVKPWPGS